jgi:hypothetical protein
VDGSRCLLTRPRLARNSELIRDDILANRYCAIIPLEEESMRREVLIDISPFTTRFQPNRFDPRACGGEGKRTNLNELLTCRFGWKGPTAARTKARTPARLDLLLLLLMPPVFGMGWDGMGLAPAHLAVTCSSSFLSETFGNPDRRRLEGGKRGRMTMSSASLRSLYRLGRPAGPSLQA